MSIRAKKPMVSVGGRLAYGAGSLGGSLPLCFIFVLLMYYGCEVHGLSGLMMGIACAVALFWSAVMVPIAGFLSDKTHSITLGKRHGYLLSAGFLVALFNALLWSTPQTLPDWGKFAWFLLGGMAFGTLNELFALPHARLCSELAGDTSEDIAIAKCSVVFKIASLVIAVVVVALLSSNASYAEFRNVGYVSSIGMLLFSALTFFGTYSHLPRLRAKADQRTDEDYPVNAAFLDFFRMLKLTNYRALLLGNGLGCAAIAVLLSGGTIVLRRAFDFSFAHIAVALGMALVFGIIAYLTWHKATDKRAIAIAGMACQLVGGLWLAGLLAIYRYGNVIDHAPVVEALPAAALVGLGAGALAAMPTHMMRDLINKYSKVDGVMPAQAQMSLLPISARIFGAGAVLLVGVAIAAAAANFDIAAWSIIGIAALCSAGSIFLFRSFLRS